MEDEFKCALAAGTEIRQALASLRSADTALTTACGRLPLTAVASAELHGILEVVRHDLIADAINTLSLVAQGDGREAG